MMNATANKQLFFSKAVVLNLGSTEQFQGLDEGHLKYDYLAKSVGLLYN